MRCVIPFDKTRGITVMQLEYYLRLPMNRFMTSREFHRISNMELGSVSRRLVDWVERGLVERRGYTGTGVQIRYEFRRLYNQITITADGIVFEVVKEG